MGKANLADFSFSKRSPSNITKKQLLIDIKMHQERMIGLCSSSGKGWLGNGHPGQYNMTFDTKQQKGEKHGENHSTNR